MEQIAPLIQSDKNMVVLCGRKFGADIWPSICTVGSPFYAMSITITYYNKSPSSSAFAMPWMNITSAAEPFPRASRPAELYREVAFDPDESK